MRPRILILIAVLLLACGSLLADPPVKGAKEIFYDPTGGAVISAPQSNSFHASPTAPSGTEGSSVGAKKGAASGSRAAKAPKAPGQTERREVVQEASNKTSPLGLSYWIDLVEQDGSGQQVTESRIFRSGERIRIHFRSNADGNIALLQLGSHGTSSVLFPDPAKGLADSRIAAGEDRILPAESAWFRFDDAPGSERILVLFARSQQELDRFSIRPTMDAAATRAALRNADEIRGGKDLILETETENASEIGTYGVNLGGQPVVMEIQLKHR